MARIGNIRLVVMGVSGCGKSSVGQALATRIGVPFVEGDDLHPQRNVALMASGTPLTDEDRQGWLQAVAASLGQAGEQGVVVSCSALKRSYRDLLRQSAPDLQLVHLTGPQALLAERLRARTGHYMPAALLPSQLQTLEPPGADEHALSLSITEPIPVLLDHILRYLEAPVS